MDFIVWILLVLGLTVSEAKMLWEKPVRVAHAGKSLSLAVSDNSDVTHVLWRSFGELNDFGIAYYSKISPDRHLISPVQLDSKNREVLDGQIIAIPSTKTLLAILSMYKESHKLGCNSFKKISGGCIDTFITVSGDQGETWTEPEPVNGDLNDYANRHAQSLLYIKELNRVIVTYVYEGTNGKEIEFSTYQISQKLTRSDIKTCPITVASMSPVKASLGYTIGRNSEITLHLVWQQANLDGKAGVFVRTASRDMGATWGPREYIGKYNTLVNSQLCSFAYSNEKFATTFTAYKSEPSVLINTDKEIIRLPNKAYSVTTCLLDDKLYVLENGFSFLRYGYIDTAKKEYISDNSEVYPFHYVETKSLACYLGINKNVKLRTVADINYWPQERKTAVEVLFSQTDHS